MLKMRLIFSKTGQAAYLSHLDIMRCFSRAFMRSGVMLKHSEGFNPHPHISIAHPLPVGFEGENEILDFELNEPEDESLTGRLSAALPGGLEVIEIYEQATPVREITAARYRIEAVYDSGEDFSARLALHFSSGSLTTEKKSKKGMVTVDLREHLLSAAVTAGEGSAVIDMRIKVAEAPINPRLFINTLPEDMAPDFVRFRREGFHVEGSLPFR